MLRIRPAQWEQFSEHVLRRFEGRMIDHLTITHPEKVACAGEGELREIIRRGIGKAATYHIEIEPDVASFIQLQFELGEHFDLDPLFPWARQILTDDDSLTADEKMESLWERVDGDFDGLMDEPSDSAEDETEMDDSLERAREREEPADLEPGREGSETGVSGLSSGDPPSGGEGT